MRRGSTGSIVGLAATVVLCVTAIAWTRAAPSNTAIRVGDDPRQGFAGAPEARPADFEIYVQQLGFGEVVGSEILEDRFACKSAANCGGQQSVSLRAAPSNYAADVAWNDALGTGKGHVVAKIVVLDPVPFDRLNLAKDDVVYLWVGAMQGGRGAALYRVRNGKATQVYKFAKLAFCKYTVYQKPAVHRNMPPKCTDTDAKPLQAPATAGQAVASLVSRPLVRARNQGFTDGLWVSCSGGCCEAQF